jgi:predicted RNase H-like HicB family nuclease
MDAFRQVVTERAAREAITVHIEGLHLDGLPAPEPRAQIVTVDVEAA